MKTFYNLDEIMIFENFYAMPIDNPIINFLVGGTMAIKYDTFIGADSHIRLFDKDNKTFESLIDNYYYTLKEEDYKNLYRGNYIDIDNDTVEQDIIPALAHNEESSILKRGYMMYNKCEINNRVGSINIYDLDKLFKSIVNKDVSEFDMIEDRVLFELLKKDFETYFKKDYKEGYTTKEKLEEYREVLIAMSLSSNFIFNGNRRKRK